MPLRLEIKKELSNRSDRVKSVDIHPSADNPWVLSALYNGNVYIWDYSNNVSVLGVLDSGLFCFKSWWTLPRGYFFPSDNKRV